MMRRARSVTSSSLAGYHNIVPRETPAGNVHSTHFGSRILKSSSKLRNVGRVAKLAGQRVAIEVSLTFNGTLDS